jgi:hypothetical protein
MSTQPFIHGIDFCFNAAEPGTQAPDGHYDLGFGFIRRGSENETWQKVAGSRGDAVRNSAFGFTFFDMSRTVTSIDFVTISLSPDGDTPAAEASLSPFSSNDQETLRKGQTLSSLGAEASRGCGDGTSTPLGNMFSAGEYALENEGEYRITVAMRITHASGNQFEFRCTAGLHVRDD